jgi:hypothetical protein
MNCSYIVLPNVEPSVYFYRTFGVLYYPIVLGLVERSASYGRTFGIPSDTKLVARTMTYVITSNVCDVIFEHSVYYCIERSA